MREAFELAWNITYLYCKHRPQFISVDHMYFYQPVEIGSVLSFTGLIIYSTERTMMVEITTEVINPSSNAMQAANVCYFTFTALDERGGAREIKAVLPHTYEEGLKYLEGSKTVQPG